MDYLRSVSLKTVSKGTDASFRPRKNFYKMRYLSAVFFVFNYVEKIKRQINNYEKKIGSFAYMLRFTACRM